MQQQFFADVIRDLIDQSGLSRAQIARQAGIPSRTIGSWANGLVNRPRHWQDLVRFAAGAQLTEAQANRLLTAADYEPVATLRFKAGNDADRSLLSPWESAETPFQLPRRDLAVFIGRSAERAHIAAVLQEGGQLCVIQGMGGVGKSTLAATVARDIAAAFPDGVLWADLRTTTPDAVLEGWGQAFGIDLTHFTSTMSRAARMWSVFAQRRILIVLDDVIDAAQVKPLLPSRHTACAILVTTRRQTVADSLTANPHNRIALTPMDMEASMALLAASADSAVVDADPETAQSICDLLGHLPLALTIFGRVCRARRRPLAAMQHRLLALRSRLDHLQLGQDEAVRTAFEQTWELMTPAERDAFRLLAVLGGRMFEGAVYAAVADVDQFSAEDQLDALYTLALLDIVSDQPRRYRQHPLLAAYAHEKLDDAAPAERRFIAYYHAFVRDNIADYTALLAEWGHTKAALEMAHRLQENGILLDMVLLLRPVWFARGLHSDSREAYRWAALAAPDDETAAAIALAHGEACLEQSDYTPARERLEFSMARFTASGDVLGSADAHYHLARVDIEQDQLTGAKDHLNAAWRGYQELEHVGGMANALYRQGRIAYQSSDYAQTDSLLVDSLKLQQLVGDERGELRVLLLLSMSALEQKELSRAQSYCEAAFAISSQLDDIGEQAACCYVLANLHRLQHSFENARAMGLKSLDFSRQEGNRATEANVLLLLARNERDAYTLSDAGDLSQALQYAQHSMAFYDEIGFTYGRAAGAVTLGLIYRGLGNRDAARASWEEGLHLAEKLSNQVLIARCSELLTTLPET
ncbi:MAG: NB-ARC domain-containing protein [Anaerolineae bacterium]|nr:NB-ARC domain-containing protein [Anaerolineae bacterium]